MKVTAQSTVKIVLGQAEIREAIRMYAQYDMARECAQWLGK